jgi:hypothetical protein
MTYELLLKTVSEVLRRIEALMSLRVGVFSFDPADREILYETASKVNGKYVLLDFRSNLDTAPCDIIFIDALPAEYHPKLALGITDDGPSRCLNGAIGRGNKVLVLKDIPPTGPRAADAFRELFAGYRKTLESYGYVFLSRRPPQGEPLAGIAGRDIESVWKNRVLTRADLLEHAGGGFMDIGRHVIVTDLAREAAAASGIGIRRLEA